MEKADFHGKLTGPCNDTVEIFLKADNEKITKASFLTDGCGVTISCGSMFSKMIEGKSIDDVLEMTPDDLINALDGLPDENLHCARLAVSTVHMALLKIK